MLTAMRHEFLIEVRKILAQGQRFLERSRAAGLGQRGILYVGYFGSSILSVVPRILERFHHDVSDIEIILKSMRKTEQVEALRGHRLDIGSARYSSRAPDLNLDTIGSEGLLAAFPSSWLPDGQSSVITDRLIEFPVFLF